MTLDELKQIKDSLSQGVMIHKGKWLEVLDAAIEAKKFEAGALYSFPPGHKLQVSNPVGMTIVGKNQNGDFICEQV